MGRRALFLFSLLTTGVAFMAPAATPVAWAFAPEGFENFGILGQGKASSYLSTTLDTTDSVWSDEYQNLEILVGAPVGSNYVTAGGRWGVGSTWGDRSNYMVRFDWRIFAMSSWSLKYAHTDWNYLSTSKDNMGLEYNTFFVWGPRSGFYFSMGYYYRWLRQRWNDPWWVPLNFHTEDRQGFLVGIFGWQAPLGANNFFTFDINARDHFDYYNIDSLAFDLTFHIASSNGFFWTLSGGTRTSATFVGTMAPSTNYIGIGIHAP